MPISNGPENNNEQLPPEWDKWSVGQREKYWYDIRPKPNSNPTEKPKTDSTPPQAPDINTLAERYNTLLTQGGVSDEQRNRLVERFKERPHPKAIKGLTDPNAGARKRKTS